MSCTECGDKPARPAKGFTRAVVEINNPSEIVLFRKVVLPASMGTEEDSPASPGRYKNVLLVYEANEHTYLYSSDGIPTLISTDVSELRQELERLGVALEEEAATRAAADDALENNIDTVQTNLDSEISAREAADDALSAAISNETTARQNADTNLQSQIDSITASSDVKDIVGTKAELNSYDTSTLGNNDIIKVLQDESEDDATTYYRWNATTSQFTLIGEEGPYYTKAQADTLLNAKQNTLTAGGNITILGDVISATDTTYTAGNGLDLTGTQFSADTTVLATQTDLSTGLAGKQDTLTAGTGIDITNNVISATSAGPTVVQTTGTSTTDVMSQNAVTSMIFRDPGTNRQVQIGDGATATGSSSVAVGPNAPGGTDAPRATQVGAVAIGAYGEALSPYTVAIAGKAANQGSVAIGWGSETTANGQFDISTRNPSYGYGNSLYRLITGVHEPINAHDAATKGYTDNLVINYATLNGSSAPTTSTAGEYVGQLYYDTTNDQMYYLSAIDDTVTPTEYTWSVIGGGPTVVQTTGTSTTDVMSQNAVTSMVFADPSTKEKIQMGRSASVTGSGSVGMGAGGVRCTGAYSVALGWATSSASRDSAALGSGAANSSSAEFSVALGSNSQTVLGHSVALGSYSKATMKGQVDISTLKNTNTYGYNNSQYRLLTGLYDGQSAHDAVTVGQLNTAIAGISGANEITSEDWSALWQ